MKRLLLVGLLCLLASNAFGARIMSETFEGANAGTYGSYDNVPDGETQGANAVMTADETVTSSIGWANWHTDCYNVDAADGYTLSNGAIAYDLGADYATTYTRLYVSIASENLDDTESNPIIKGNSVLPFGTNFVITVQQDSGVLYFYATGYTQGGGAGTNTKIDVPITLGEPYLVEVEWDYRGVGDGDFSVRVNLVEGFSEAMTGTCVTTDTIQIGWLSKPGVQQGADINFDNLAVDDADWCGIKPINDASIKIMCLGDPHWDTVTATVDRDAALYDMIEWAENRDADLVWTTGDNVTSQALDPTNVVDAVIAADKDVPTVFGLGNHDYWTSYANTITTVNDYSGLPYAPVMPVDDAYADYVVNVGETYQILHISRSIDEDESVSWLSDALDNATTNSKKVILFTHEPAGQYPACPVFCNGNTNAGTLTITSGDTSTEGSAITFDFDGTLTAGQVAELATNTHQLVFTWADNPLGPSNQNRTFPWPWVGTFLNPPHGSVSTSGITGGRATVCCPVSPARLGVVTYFAGQGKVISNPDEWPYNMIYYNTLSFNDEVHDLLETKIAAGAEVVMVITGHIHYGTFPERQTGTTYDISGSDVPFWNLRASLSNRYEDDYTDEDGYYYVGENQSGARYLLELTSTTQTMTAYPGAVVNGPPKQNVIAFYDASDDETRWYNTKSQLELKETPLGDAGSGGNDVISMVDKTFSIDLGGGWNTWGSVMAKTDTVIWEDLNIDMTYYNEVPFTLDVDRMDFVRSRLTNPNGYALVLDGGKANEVVGNQLVDGGVSFDGSTNPTVQFNSIYNANDDGVYLPSGISTIKATCIWGSTGDDIEVADGATLSGLNIFMEDAAANTNTTGSFISTDCFLGETSDPFEDAANNIFRPVPGTNLIDNGDQKNANYPEDYTGRAEYYGTAVDIGSIERFPSKGSERKIRLGLRP